MNSPIKKDLHQWVLEKLWGHAEAAIKLLFPSLSSPRSKYQDSELDFNLPDKEKYINESEPSLPKNITTPITESS